MLITARSVLSPGRMIDAPNENDYEVEKILQKRTRDGVTEYLVRWLGYVMTSFVRLKADFHSVIFVARLTVRYRLLAITQLPFNSK